VILTSPNDLGGGFLLPRPPGSFVGLSAGSVGTDATLEQSGVARQASALSSPKKRPEILYLGRSRDRPRFLGGLSGFCQDAAGQRRPPKKLKLFTLLVYPDV